MSEGAVKFIRLKNKKTGSWVAIDTRDVLLIGVAPGGGSEILLRQGVNLQVHDSFGEVLESVTGRENLEPTPEE